MNWWLLIIIPVTSAFIGWAANRILISLLFHPKKPLQIAGFTIQGIFPKRQAQLAKQLGGLVSRELVSFSEIEEKITSPDILKKIMPVAEQHIDDFLHNRLKESFPMISMFIGGKTLNNLKTLFMNELERIFPVIMKNYIQNLQQDINIEQLVADKVAALSPDMLEASLYQAVGKELRLTGLTGAALGFLIGLIQVVVILTLL
jgi:uncharacterized membrane protein YheB (UPF0754 family)